MTTSQGFYRLLFVYLSGTVIPMKPFILKNDDSRQAKVKALLETVNIASRQTRNHLATMLITGLYIALITWSTTDEMLLRISPVELPLIKVKLPLIEFYRFTPYFYLFIHFNLLFQFYILSHKLNRLKLEIDQLSPASELNFYRNLLFPFSFSQRVIGNHYPITQKKMMTVINWFTLLWFPPLLLLALQIGFLAYHGEAVLWWQRIALMIDLVVIWLMWPIIESSTNQWKDWFSHCSKFWFGCALFITIVISCFSLFIAVLPGSPMEQRVNSFLSWANMNTCKKADTSNKEKTCYKQFIQWLFEDQKAPFHRNLHLKDKILIANPLTPEIIHLLQQTDGKELKSIHKRIIGIDLKGRNLSYADFSNSYLPKIDMRKLSNDTPTNVAYAKMGGAMLYGANISDADFTGANLIKAKLRSVKAAGTIFSKIKANNIEFQNAQLTQALFDHAELEKSNFQRAYLYETNFCSAKLNSAKMQMSNLTGAILYKASLSLANLAKANLTRANLTGADLSDAIVDITILNSEGLREANWTHTTLIDALDANLADLLEDCLGCATPADADVSDKCRLPQSDAKIE